MTEPQDNVLDLQKYRESKLKKVEAKQARDTLDDLSFVMEMSTDELLSELACRLEFGKSMRDVSDDLLVDELMQRNSAIEFLIYTFIEKNSKETP